MLEPIPRQWSTKMATSCAQTGMRRNRRKAAPTSIILPERQFLLSPEKRTWRSCFRDSISSRGSRDSGLALTDHDSLLSPDSGFHSSTRTSKAGRSTCASPWAWPFETKSDLTSPKMGSPGGWPFSRRTSGLHSATLLPPKPNVTSSPNRRRSSSLCKQTSQKDQTVDGIVARLCARAQTSMNFVEAAGGSKSSSRSRRSSVQTSSSGAVSANSSLTSLNSMIKRGRDPGDDEEDEQSDEKDRRGKKIRDQSPSREPVPCKLFACPYAKHEPTRYSHQNMTELDYRHCSVGYWPTIARLKQHLYRTHDRSQLCCSRCWQSFTNASAYQKHIESSKCEDRQLPIEKMDLEKYNLIKERSNGDPVLLWYKIFEILFPNAERPHSPYAELVIGADMRDLFRNIQERLPTLLRRSVAERFEDLRQDDESSDTVLDAVLEDCLSDALQTIGTEFAVPRGMQHIFAPASTTPAVANMPDIAEPSAIEVAQSSGIPLRPRLARLPTVVSVLSESTVVASEQPPVFANDQSLRLRGSAQPSDASIFDPNNDLSFHPYDYDVDMEMALWEPSEGAWEATTTTDNNSSLYYHHDHHLSNAIPIDLQLHHPRFNEPGRPEFPFPRSDPSSSASSLYTEDRSLPIAYNNSSTGMNIAHQRGSSDDYGVQHRTPSNTNGGLSSGSQQQPHFGSGLHCTVEDFNSYSDVTGMQVFF